MPVVEGKLSALKGNLTLFVEYGTTSHGTSPSTTNASASYTGKSYTSKGKQTISNLKCSNPSVLRVQHTNAPKYNYRHIYLRALKPGKATISFKYCGKARKVTVTVKKYVNPCKQFLIGKKDYAARFNKNSNNCNVSYTYGKKKVYIVPKKGWKVKSITAMMYPSPIKVKNGAKLPASMKDGGNVCVVLQNTKNKGLIELCV